jgi:hypothetical protein
VYVHVHVHVHVHVRVCACACVCMRACVRIGVGPSLLWRSGAGPLPPLNNSWVLCGGYCHRPSLPLLSSEDALWLTGMEALNDTCQRWHAAVEAAARTTAHAAQTRAVASAVEVATAATDARWTAEVCVGVQSSA